MQELAKILKKIERYIKIYQMPPLGREAEGTVELLEECRNIIRKQINAGWIPVEERLPTEEEQKKDGGDFEITIWNEYKQSKPFVSRGYFNGSEFELQDKDYSTFAEVIAWQPLPEPYRPERSDNHDRE